MGMTARVTLAAVQAVYELHGAVYLQYFSRTSSRRRKFGRFSSEGSNTSQTPPGLRKSGTPDSVLKPAPVKTTTFFDATIISATTSICSTIDLQNQLPFQPRIGARGKLQLESSEG